MRKRQLAALLGSAILLFPACDGDGNRDNIEDPRGGNEEAPGEDDGIIATPTGDE